MCWSEQTKFSHMKSLSIIIPTHNNAVVIGRTLQSVEDSCSLPGIPIHVIRDSCHPGLRFSKADVKTLSKGARTTV
jgi:hypothetical protein